MSHLTPPERGLISAMMSSPPMQSAYSDQALIDAMLRFEAALARAQADCGMVPPACADLIEAITQRIVIDRASLAVAAPAAGNLAIPLIKQLTLGVRAESAEAARFVHFGATSQDVIDSAAMLQAKNGLSLLAQDLAAINAALATIARDEAKTAMAGRTWLQHAVPVTLGLKAAGWLDALVTVHARLLATASGLPLQFGGAAGTLASLGEKGDEVTDALAGRLGLARPRLPWHGSRLPIVDIGAVLALVAGTLGKIARDVSLMMQNEVAELSEPHAPGKGGSSTMAHKRNPVGCALALTAAQRAPQLLASLYAGLVGEHERSLGSWQAEWSTLPELFLLASGSTHAMRSVLAGLEIDRVQMTRNLNLDDGLSMAEAATFALARRLDRDRAQDIVATAIARSRAGGQSLLHALRSDAEVVAAFDDDELVRLMEPSGYLGSSAAMIARVLARYQANPSCGSDDGVH